MTCPEWGDSVVPFMCSVLASNSDPVRRKFSLSVLTHYTDPREVPYLIPLLRDPDDKIVEGALYAMWKHKDPTLAQPLFEALPHLSYELALHAAHNLAEIPNGIPFDVTSATLIKSAREDLQKIGCVVLIGSQDPRVIPALTERLGRLTDHKSTGRKMDWAGYALGQAHATGVTDAIIAALADPDPTRRYGALNAAQWHRLKPDHAALLEPVLRLTFDRDDTVQAQAQRALSTFSDDLAVAALRAVIEAGGDMAIIAVDSLHDNGSPTAKPTMIACLRHPDVDVRKRLLMRLRSQTLPADIDKSAILALLNDPDFEVVRMAKEIAKNLTLTPDEQRELDAVGK